MTAAHSISASIDSEELYFEELRGREYARLDADDHAYLDFTGSGLYAERQVTKHADRLRSSLFGNPHSENGPSLFTTAVIHRAKSRLLDFVDAPHDEYVVVFTANTSAAIKLVAESFPFTRDSALVLSADNHNSVNGIREFARAAHSATSYVELNHELHLVDARGTLAQKRRSDHDLFAFPAQSNFSGVKHSLALIKQAQKLGYRVLLDAAAFLPTNRWSLREYPADFVALSMYKVSGYPTGVGALIARKESLAMLTRPWFAGGTVQYASVQNDRHMLLVRNGEGFEDGTPAFLDIAAVADGLDLIDEIGIDRINRHVTTHAMTFLEGLTRLCSRSGARLVRVYGPRPGATRGATIAFNVIGADGNTVPFGRVVERARNEGVSLRGGCFCNPGASERAFGFLAQRTASCLDALGSGFSIDKFSECLGPDIPVGAVRASMGIATNRRDVDRALAVVASFG
ncbi:MAG TPA: aminotransferase class V-fold PLP-dependent enzyme [Gemmatimonadaceae bacterium]|nr:aminotransferase class V-fold PLP-dependent enzyme [Gemmatimonadaceae bacterium]